MIYSILDSLFNRRNNEPFIGVDIGTSTIKLMSIEVNGDRCKLLSAGVVPTPANAIGNNAVVKPEQTAQAIRSLIEANEIKGLRATVALPGPAVFSKKITLAYADPEDLEANLRFEASNYIPHSVDAVHLDYQLLKVHGGSTMDLLLVAVKNEIMNSYLNVLERAGLEPAIADVDYFALENMFELNYPEEKNRTVALLNIGARYTSVSILQDGQSLFTGDIPVGGRLYTDALVEAAGMQPADAEKAKAGCEVKGFDQNLINETLDRTTEHMAGELQRQLAFFWNTAATDRSIEAIYISGGASRVPGLVEEIGVRTGMVCKAIEPLRAVQWMEQFDRDYIEEIQSSLAVSVGLAVRRFGDKRNAVRD